MVTSIILQVSDHLDIQTDTCRKCMELLVSSCDPHGSYFWLRTHRLQIAEPFHGSWISSPLPAWPAPSFTPVQILPLHPKVMELWQRILLTSLLEKITKNTIPNSKSSDREGNLSECSGMCCPGILWKKKKNHVVFGNKTRLSNRSTWERICSQGDYFTTGTVWELMCLTRDTPCQHELG